MDLRAPKHLRYLHVLPQPHTRVRQRRDAVQPVRVLWLRVVLDKVTERPAVDKWEARVAYDDLVLLDGGSPRLTCFPPGVTCFTQRAHVQHEIVCPLNTSSPPLLHQQASLALSVRRSARKSRQESLPIHAAPRSYLPAAGPLAPCAHDACGIFAYLASSLSTRPSLQWCTWHCRFVLPGRSDGNTSS